MLKKSHYIKDINKNYNIKLLITDKTMKMYWLKQKEILLLPLQRVAGGSFYFQ